MAIPVGFCEIWFGWQLAGDPDPMYTHLAYSVAGTPDQASVDAGFTAFISNFRAFVNSDYLLIGGHVLVGDTAGAIRWDFTGTPLAGNSGNATVPQNTAWLVKKSTALGGRRNRGRMFFPGVHEIDVSNIGELSGAAVTARQTQVSKLEAGGSIVTAFGFIVTPVLLHQSGSSTPTGITGLTVQKTVATQRRRLRR